ncbi:hypothetical protein BC829DRAFT_360393 [Chytridium lagenaria]|nr:hypothetical protein BC829DRAFT_360393 [Chytridium lagenaria]
MDADVPTRRRNSVEVVPNNVSTPPDIAKDLLRLGLPAPVADKLIRQSYIGAYDRRTRNAHWVAEKLTKDSIKKPSEGDTPDRQKAVFREDSSILKMFRSRPLDYAGTGYDRGHLVPAADVQSNQEAVNETFLMTNISPQVANFNRGLWASFERFARNLVNVMDSVYVITGPLYLPKLEPDGKFYIRYEVIGSGEKSVAVPTHFFKVILGEKSGKYYMDGFVLPNEESTRDTSVTTFITPVEAIERSSGLLFFGGVDRKMTLPLCSMAKCDTMLAFKFKMKENAELE